MLGFVFIFDLSLYTAETPYLRAYSQDPETITRCRQIMYVVFLFMLTDSTRGVLKGTTKAMGLYQQVMP